jgi:hypothetical protein
MLHHMIEPSARGLTVGDDPSWGRRRFGSGRADKQIDQFIKSPQGGESTISRLKWNMGGCVTARQRIMFIFLTLSNFLVKYIKFSMSD